MFLNMLNEKEGKNFIELSAIAMKVDGIVEDRELGIIDTYKKEMGLLDYVIVDKDYKTIVTEFQASKKSVKRAVIIELAGVLDADEKIDEKEEVWINKLGKEWGFREPEIKKMVRWTQDFNDLLMEGYEYINKR